MSSSRSTAAWYDTRNKRGLYRRVENPIVSSPPPPLGDILLIMQLGDLGGRAKEFGETAKIVHARTVTSYNWMNKTASVPTILVPGKPPLWTPQSVPSRLNEDSGSYFRDKNAARYPKHPMEPMVVVSLDADPTIPSEVDIVACGSTLGNLLRFVRGEDKPFRILAYKVGNSVFLVRRENSPTELIPGVRGFGHAFPEANTTWEREVKGSASYQRVIRYTFGGMELLVRFEADGYIKEKNVPEPAASASGDTATEEEKAPLASVDDLVSSLLTTTVSTADTSNPPGSNTLQVKHGGSTVSQSSLFDLKTRSIYTRGKRDILAEELPRLWLRQIPNFILAYHTQGLFMTQDTEIKDVREEMKKWEHEHAAKLAKLAALLSWIKDVVVENSDAGGKVEICYSGGLKLEVRRQLEDAGEVLSAKVRERWEEGLHRTVESKEKESYETEPDAREME